MRQTVIIADNHPVFRNGVRQIVEETGDYKVLAEVGDGEACIFQIETLKPDIVILDLNMPKKSGFDVVDYLRRHSIPCRTIVISMHSSAEFVEHAKELGCNAFVAKEDAQDGLLEALSKSDNEFYMSGSSGSNQETFEISSSAKSTENAHIQKILTPSEKNILQNIARSRSSSEIAEIMNVSIRTVHSHRQNICRKLELNGINSLVRYAVENRDAINKLVI